MKRLEQLAHERKGGQADAKRFEKTRWSFGSCHAQEEVNKRAKELIADVQKGGQQTEPSDRSWPVPETVDERESNFIKYVGQKVKVPAEDCLVSFP